MKNDLDIVNQGYYAWLKVNNLDDNDENTSKFVELWRHYGLDK